MPCKSTWDERSRFCRLISLSGVVGKFSFPLFGLLIECFDVAWPGKHDLCHHRQFESDKNNKKNVDSGISLFNADSGIFCEGRERGRRAKFLSSPNEY